MMDDDDIEYERQREYLADTGLEDFFDADPDDYRDWCMDRAGHARTLATISSYWNE